MDGLDWSLLGEDESLQALRQFLDTKPTESVTSEPLPIQQSKDATTAPVAMPKMANGQVSPPEITPSPPSSGETSPEAASHKRKNDESVKPTEDAPTTKTRRATNDSEDDAAAKANGNGKTTDRRKEQNRNAQRAFRERKEKRLHELEDQVSDLARKQELTSNENSNLRDLVARLKAENTRLSAFEQAFTFNVATSGVKFPATQAQADPSPPPQAKEQTDSGAEFAALVRSVQQHLGNAATHSFGPNFGTGTPSRPEVVARQPSVSSGGSAGSPFELLRSVSSDTGASRGAKSMSPPSVTGQENARASSASADNLFASASSFAGTGPSPNGSGGDAWASFGRSNGAGGDLVGDLTFLNGWDTNSMSFLNDPSSSSGSSSLPFATPSTELKALDADQASTPWWSDASSWALTAPGDLGTGSFGASTTSTAPSTGLAPPASFGANPLSVLATASVGGVDSVNASCAGLSGDEVNNFVASGFVTEGELDGLCDLMKSKATCKEKTALLDQVGRHKPNLVPAVELLKARRREEIERNLSLAGGV